MSVNDIVKLRVVDIIDGTTVDGPGFRTSIYFAGCEHHCPGCQNPSTWDADSGYEVSVGELMAHIEKNGFDVTFSGGDPLFQIDSLLTLALEIRRSGKKIWCYTGYCYEQILYNTRFAKILPYIEVLVDGPFIESRRDTSLLFRGSSNQRLVDVKKSIESGTVVVWESSF